MERARNEKRVLIARSAIAGGVACAAAFLAGAVPVIARHGNAWRLSSLLLVVLGWTIAAAVWSALLASIMVATPRRLGRVMLTVLGGLSAIVPFALFIVLLRDGDDPATISGYVSFWSRVPGELFLGFAPLCVPGAIVGWFVGSSNMRVASQPGCSS